MMRPPNSNSIGRVLGAFALLLAGIASAQSTTTSPTQPAKLIVVATAADAEWLVRPGAKEDGKPRWLVLRRSLPSPDGLWTPIATLTALPRSMAAFGERLAVIYDDGSWSIIAPGAQITGLMPPGISRFESVQSSAQGLTFLARSDSKAQLFDFNGSTFSAPREAQAASTPASTVTLAAVSDSAASSNGRFFASRSGDFVGVADLEESRQALVQLAPAAMKQGLSLSRDLDGSPRFWWLDGERVLSQAFSFSDGMSKAEPDEASIRPPPSPTLFERGLYVMGALTLVLVLFAGGRQTMVASRLLAAKAPPSPAPLARRLAAGIIDFVPLAVCVAYLATGNKLTIFAGMLRFDKPQSEAILAAGVLFYLVLLIAFEIQWQRSIGKWVFALRVVALDGSKPKPTAVLLRNVLRLVDLNLITLLFVPVTPLRQRLGDFLAGTMVVDALEPDTTSTDFSARKTRLEAPPERKRPDDDLTDKKQSDKNDDVK